MSFDDIRHTYYDKARRLPSVTQLVVDECSWWTEEARARGRAIHEWAEALDRGRRTVDLYDLPVDWRGYGRALLSAYDATAPRWTEIEQPRINTRIGYGGRRDRVGVVFASVVIVDLKTGEPDTWHGPQLAGYDRLDALHRGIVRRRRFGLYLAASGAYKYREFVDPNDDAIFLQRTADYWAGRRSLVTPEDL